MRLGLMLSAIVIVFLGLTIFPLRKPFERTQHYFRDPNTGCWHLDPGLSYVGWVIGGIGMSFVWFGVPLCILGIVERRDPKASILRDFRDSLWFVSAPALGLVAMMIWLNSGPLFELIGGSGLEGITQLVEMTGMSELILMFFVGGMITIGEFLLRKIRRAKLSESIFV